MKEAKKIKDDLVPLGNRIKEVRRALHLQQKEVAARGGYGGQLNPKRKTSNLFI